LIYTIKRNISKNGDLKFVPTPNIVTVESEFDCINIKKD
jgi:hypothetical protein